MLMNPTHDPHPGERPHGAPLAEDIGSMVRSVLAVLRRRYLALCAVAALVMGLFVVLLLMMTPRYEAAARVKIDPKPTAMNGVGPDQGPSMPDQYIVDTEVSAMRSRDIALLVIQDLHLDQDPEFTGALDKDPALRADPAARINAVVKAVDSRLSIQREKLTYIVDVSFKSVDAAKAARIANDYADAYIRESIARRTRTAEQQYAWLDKRLEALSGQTRSADAAVAQYKASNGLTEGGQQGTITDQQIAPLSTQLATAQAEAAAAHSDLAVARQQMAAGGATAASSVLNSPAIQTLRANRASIQQMMSQLGTRYGPEHPQTVQAQQQLQAIDQQIKEEASRIIGELTAKSKAADAQVASLSSGVGRLRGEQASNARASVAADALSRDADSKRSAYNRLSSTAQQVEQGAQSSASQAQVIERAIVPERPSSPKTFKVLSLGLLVALTAGLATVVAQELLMAGFVESRDMENSLGVKLLASAPRLTRKELAKDGVATPADSLLKRPMSPYAEAFRAIRSTMRIAQPQPKVVSLVSSLPGEGKTTSALSLARIIALSGERTLLIDADVRQSGLGKLIGARPAKGLVEVLHGQVPLEAALVRDQTSGLDVLTAAEASFVTTDLFGGAAFADLLAHARAHYDRVVIDTPPLLGVAEARTLATLADAVLLVVRWKATSRSVVKEAVKWLRADNAPLIGTLMTLADPKAEAFGTFYYSKVYAQYYQAA